MVEFAPEFAVDLIDPVEFCHSADDLPILSSLEKCYHDAQKRINKYLLQSKKIWFKHRQIPYAEQGSENSGNALIFCMQCNNIVP